ncbi:hypothetical protein FACS1894219_12660 [Clostridia bacterium]|nr:hypothetical protein FACS1894219_12660 [Clostridia bacterium]
MAYSDELWAEAKKKCRLNTEDIALAKRLGLNPRSLIKNIPSKSQQWKAPVKDWLHEIDAKRQKKSEQKQKRKEKVAQTAKKADAMPTEPEHTQQPTE